MPADLNQSLAWSWHAPDFNTVLWGSLIDAQRNIYIAGYHGIWKFSPAGRQLWFSNMSTEMPTLVGGTLVGMRMLDCTAFALNIETGAIVWSRRLWPNNGLHGDFVEVHNGVAIVAVGADSFSMSGSESTHVAGVSIEDGKQLWEFRPDCGLWNIMALFPDNDTAVFSDKCGGAYRVGLYNGTQLWHAPGPHQSFTDGGAMIGPDSSVYTCSNPAGTSGLPLEPGVLRRYRLSDGARLWEVELPLPCVNFPAVSMDGRSVVVAPGALAGLAQIKTMRGKPLEAQRRAYELQRSLLAANQQRSYYHQPDLEASIMSFDAVTGSLQWEHKVKPWGGLAFAGDEKRAWNAIRQDKSKADPLGNQAFAGDQRLAGNANRLDIPVEHCWPAHWSAPTIDQEGTIYIGRSSGDFHVYNPHTGQESIFHTGDGIMMAGASFAPGLMVFATCSSVYAFHVPPA